MTNSVASYFVGVPGGLIMSMIAFSIVFIVIAGLMFLMMALHAACVVFEGKKKNAAAPAASKQAAGPTAQANQAVAAPDPDSGVLLAVISAAVAAACGTAARVISYTPVRAKSPAASSWKLFARIRNTQSIDD